MAKIVSLALFLLLVLGVTCDTINKSQKIAFLSSAQSTLDQLPLSSQKLQNQANVELLSSNIQSQANVISEQIAQMKNVQPIFKRDSEQTQSQIQNQKGNIQVDQTKIRDLDEARNDALNKISDLQNWLSGNCQGCLEVILLEKYIKMEQAIKAVAGNEQNSQIQIMALEQCILDIEQSYQKMVTDPFNGIHQIIRDGKQIERKVKDNDIQSKVNHIQQKVNHIQQKVNGIQTQKNDVNNTRIEHLVESAGAIKVTEQVSKRADQKTNEDNEKTSNSKQIVSQNVGVNENGQFELKQNQKQEQPNPYNGESDSTNDDQSNDGQNVIDQKRNHIVFDISDNDFKQLEKYFIIENTRIGNVQQAGANEKLQIKREIHQGGENVEQRLGRPRPTPEQIVYDLQRAQGDIKQPNQEQTWILQNQEQHYENNEVDQKSDILQDEENVDELVEDQSSSLIYDYTKADIQKGIGEVKDEEQAYWDSTFPQNIPQPNPNPVVEPYNYPIGVNQDTDKESNDDEKGNYDAGDAAGDAGEDVGRVIFDIPI